MPISASTIGRARIEDEILTVERHRLVAHGEQAPDGDHLAVQRHPEVLADALGVALIVFTDRNRTDVSSLLNSSSSACRPKVAVPSTSGFTNVPRPRLAVDQPLVQQDVDRPAHGHRADLVPLAQLRFRGQPVAGPQFAPWRSGGGEWRQAGGKVARRNRGRCRGPCVPCPAGTCGSLVAMRASLPVDASGCNNCRDACLRVASYTTFSHLTSSLGYYIIDEVSTAE